MKIKLLYKAILIFSAVASASSQAEIIVKGNQIQWDQYGWYQVLDSENYNSLCEGFNFCTVESGTYIVINLTNNQRWDNIEVKHSEPVVNGQQITLPHDGWFEVQTASGFDTICEGVSNCLVEPGTYNVINHTNNVRWENIIVRETTPEPLQGVFVSGNTISWTESGWIQVQNSTSYESICQGGTSCIVKNGVYNIINHTTNSRIEGVVVETSESEAPETIVQVEQEGTYENLDLVQNHEPETDFNSDRNRCEATNTASFLFNSLGCNVGTCSRASPRALVNEKLIRIFRESEDCPVVEAHYSIRYEGESERKEVNWFLIDPAKSTTSFEFQSNEKGRHEVDFFVADACGCYSETESHEIVFQ